MLETTNVIYQTCPDWLDRMEQFMDEQVLVFEGYHINLGHFCKRKLRGLTKFAVFKARENTDRMNQLSLRLNKATIDIRIQTVW